MIISFHDVWQDNWRLALQLAVRPEQQHFVAEYAPIAAIALSKAYIRSNNYSYHPLLVYAASEPVGFLLLGRPPNQPTQLWLYHFFIDQRYQHQGYGSAALSALFRFVQQVYPEVKHLLLTVHPDNQAARRLYLRHGFQATGEHRDGEAVYQRDVSAEQE